MSRADQYNVTVSLDGNGLGTWDKMSGGEKDSEESKYRPGGMQATLSLGGYTTVGNVTVSRLFKLDRDYAQLSNLLDRVGRGAVVVTKQSLDTDGNPYGKPTVYTGILKTVTPPEHDSESSDAALIEIEVSVATVQGPTV
jgi:hypothetical protein